MVVVGVMVPPPDWFGPSWAFAHAAPRQRANSVRPTVHNVRFILAPPAEMDRAGVLIQHAVV